MNYVIIGNGVAGTTAAEQIRQADSNGKITIISDEEYPFYSRIRLIEFLAGTLEVNDIIMKKDNWYSENKIEIILNDPVIKIDQKSKNVMTQSKQNISYDKLLIASGANAFVPPIPGSDKNGVFSLRRIKDAIAIKNHCLGGKKNIVIIGGGVLGLETGFALQKHGHNLIIIEALPRLLPRQMDPEGSEILKFQMESFSFSMFIGRMTKEITGTYQVDGILLDDGTKIDCDVVIISAGIRADLTLANQLGLTVDKGIVVNDNLTTDDPAIFSAGDGIIHNHRLYGIWPASEAQGRIAGINMAGGNEIYKGTTISNVLKVVGIDLVSIGEIDADNKFESNVKKDTKNFLYKKLIFKDDIIIGAILFGDKKNWLKIKRAIENKINIKNIKEQLLKWDLSGLK